MDDRRIQDGFQYFLNVCASIMLQLQPALQKLHYNMTGAYVGESHSVPWTCPILFPAL